MSRPLAVPELEQYRMGIYSGEAFMRAKTEELWQELHDGLRAFIVKRVNDQGHVEDILQEVFLRVHRQIDSVQDTRRIVSWIYQVTRNVIIDHYRKPGRQREIPTGLSEALQSLDELPTFSETARSDESEESRTELAGCLRPMIEQLSPDYREAINLVELEGLTQHTAAKRIGISLSGMKSRVQRGRKQLKQMLDDCCLIELDGRGGVIDYRARTAECDACTRPKWADRSE